MNKWQEFVCCVSDYLESVSQQSPSSVVVTACQCAQCYCAWFQVLCKLIVFTTLGPHASLCIVPPFDLPYPTSQTTQVHIHQILYCQCDAMYWVAFTLSTNHTDLLKYCYPHTWMCFASSHSSLHNQVKRFGNPTWRRLVEAVEDPVGGNDHALAQKIAAKHPGMQPILIWKETIFAFSLYIHQYNEHAGNY